MSNYLKKLEEIKKKAYGTSESGEVQQNNSTDKSSSTKKDNNASLSVLERVKARANGEYQITSDYINSFVSDANSYFSNAEKEYNGLGWGTASSAYYARREKWNDLETRANQISSWLNANKTNLDKDTYDSIYDSIEYVRNNGSSVLNSFIGAKQFYAQFGSEEEYTKWKTEEDARQAVLSAEDFGHYSKAGANIKNPEYDNARVYKENLWEMLFKEDINNVVTFGRDNKAALEEARGQAGSNYDLGVLNEYLMFNHLTDEEVSIYNYYLGKGDTEKAEEYLTHLKDIANQREAGALYERHNNTALEAVFAFGAGVDQGLAGIRNIGAFITGGEGEKPTAQQYAYGQMSGDNEGAWKVTNDLMQTTGNMLPSIIVGTVTGGAGGAITMGVSATGNAYSEMREAGYNEWQARGYGVLVGASEAALQYALGGISPLGNASGGMLSKVTTSALNKVDNALARFAIEFGSNMFDEAFEEAAQSVLEPIFKAIFTGEEANVDWGEVAYSALLGALSAGFLEGVPTGVGTIHSNYESNVTNGGLSNTGAVSAFFKGNENGTKGFKGVSEAYKSGKKSVNEMAGAYVNEALDIDPDNAHAQRMQARLDKGKNVSGYQINRLVEANENALVSQDKTKMKSAVEARLTELGESGDVSALADIIVKKESGEKLSRSESKLLRESENGEWVADELSTDPTFKGHEDFDNSWTGNLGTERINTEAYNRGSSTPIEQARTNPAAKDTTTAKAPTEANLGAYTNAKVTIERDGEAVEVKPQKIASIEGDSMTIELEGGEVVDATEVDFGESQIGLVYQAAKDMSSRVGGFNIDTANVFVRGYNSESGITAAEYVHGFSDAYRFGKMGYPVSELAKGVYTSRLTEENRKTAYNFGKAFGNDEVANKSAKIASTGANISEKDSQKGSAKKKGKVHFDGRNVRTDINEMQRASLDTLDVVAEAMGIDIYVFESPLVNGKRQGENGWYNPKTHEMGIDLHAGVNGNALMLYAGSHELSHHIKEVNPVGFKVFADALFEEYGKHGISVEDLIQAKLEDLEKNGRLEGKTDEQAYDLAYEEVVADACEAMLVDSDAIKALSKKIYAKDKGLWQTIKDFITNLIARVKAAYKGLNPDSREANLVREMEDSAKRLQKLWVDALLGASEVQSSAETTLLENGISVDSNTESGSLFSVRDVLSDADRKKVSKALATRFGVTQEEAVEWLNAETSLASLILNPKYSQYLDYTPDPNEVAIKENSDYPQGTVDFSPICAKRREFTAVTNNILRLFPNHVFAATDLAKIRTIMQEEGMTIPCGICFVEDRRQLDTIVAQNFIDSLKLYREGSKTRPDGKPFNTNQLNGLKLIDGDDYTPSIYELVSLEGLNRLKEKNPQMAEAWVKFNNARGMQSVRLLANEAEYKRQILKYNKNTVKSKNDKGGLRIYSFSDMEMFHLIDIIQVITDSAAVGLSLQGYTKVNEYARAVKDTGEKLNRSLIPKGDLGYHIEDGKVVLDYDTVEGIDINHPDFFDNMDNPNIGNITIGVSDVQIRAAMVSDFVDQIIPFHTGQSEEVLGEKGIATWENYKDFQKEKDIATGKASDHQINIYTEVLQVLEKEGKPINKRTFVEKFLQVCKENNLTPRFSQFLNTNEKGEYTYTEGYHKFLVDFKTFDQRTGEYLPQMPVKPIFDNEYMTKILKDYVKSQKVKDAEIAESMPKVIDRITKEIVEPSGNAKYSDRTINPYDGKSLYADSEVYDYSFMVSLDPMTVKTMPPLSTVKEDGRISQERTIELGLANAASIGVKVSDGQYAVKNAYTKRDIIIGKGGLKHGLDASSMSRLRTNSRLSAIGGYIVQNAVPINGLTKENKQANGTYAMACLLNDGNGFVVAIVTVDEFSSRATNFDFVEITHSINGRFLANKEDSRSSTRELELGDKSLSTTAISEISIADFLEIVNSSHQSILSNDVLAHLGETRNPDGHYAKRVLFSDRDSLGNELSKEQQEFFKDSKVRDENGNLLVVYHGTTKGGFTVFDASYSDDRRSLFFTSSKKTAQSYGITGNVFGDKDFEARSPITTVDEAKEYFDGIYWRVIEYQDGKYWDGNKLYQHYNKNVKYSLQNNQGHTKGNFTSDQELIDYAERSAQETDLQKVKTGLYEVYLNLKNPLIVDAKGHSWNQIDFLPPELEPIVKKQKENLQKIGKRIKELRAYADERDITLRDAMDRDREYARLGDEDIALQEEYDSFMEANGLSMDANTRDISRYAKKHGYDGVLIKNIYDSGQYDIFNDAGMAEYIAVAFDSNQAKLTTNKTPTSDPDTRYSDRTSYAPTFYSHMGKVIDDVKLEKMGTSSILNHLKNRGVKDEELKWSGIEAFLEGKKSVTKAELQEFVARSQLVIEEEMSSEESWNIVKDGDDYIVKDKDGNILETWETIQDPEDPNLTGWVSLEGGDIASSIEEIREYTSDWYGNEGTRWSQYRLDGGTNYRELVFKMPNATHSNRAMRVHWGEDAEGVLVHARIQDFNVDGKKMLFIEELQSDWHNEGHEKGYTTKEYEDAVAVYDKLAEDYANKRRAFNKYVRSGEFRSDPDEVSKKKFDWLRGKMDTAEKRMQDAERDVEVLKKKGMGDTPDAPFRSTYHEYVLKRLLRMAAEEGYDSIGWTPSGIQSDRWSDEFAEAYRIEYDQDMPKFLRKYGKKWGATVGHTMLDQGRKPWQSVDAIKKMLAYWQNELATHPESEEFIRVQIKHYEEELRTAQATGETVWSMDITDSMKESVLYEGQVLYSDRNTASFKGKAFWSGSVSLLDGEIEETHTIEEAEDADFHHSMYFSQAQIEKMENGENAFFWVDNGNVYGDWRESIPQDIIERIKEQIKVSPANTEAREFSDVDIKYSIREEAPPRKTKEGYKVFVVRNGKLYPPMVANPNAEDTPVGVWLNADVGTRAPDSKTGRMQVKAGGKGTQGGSGSLAFRPGWHLGETPLATQFDRLNPETGVKELFPENFVWALCDIAADHDYQEEAMSYGYTKNGKFQHSLAGLPKLPTDGYYKYRTNPNPDTVPWLITGAMKVKKLLSDAEVNAILVEKGLAPKQRVGGEKTLADLGLSEYEGKLYSDRPTESFSNRSLLANALESAAQNDIERDKLRQYKEKIDLINAEEQKLHELREQIKELSFAKGARDTERIKSLQFEATQAANRINTYDRQLLNLESTKALKGVLDREKAQARKRAEQKAEQRRKDDLAKAKERAAKTERELMNRYQESRKKGIESRNKTALRKKIRNVVQDLRHLLNHGTKEKHVKEELKEMVADALALADLVFSDDIRNEDIVRIGVEVVTEKEETLLKEYAELLDKRDDIVAEIGDIHKNVHEADEALAKIGSEEEKLAKIKNRLSTLNGKLAGVFERERARINKATASKLMADLANEFLKLKDADADYIRSAYESNKYIHNRLVALSEAIGGTIARDMSIDQLTELYDAYKMVAHFVRYANTSFKTEKGETIMQMAEAVNDQVRTVGGQPYKRNVVSLALQRVGWTFLKPLVAFRTIGSVTLTNLYKELRNGEDTFYADVKDAQKFIEDQYKKHGYKSWDMKKPYTFKSNSGKSFDLTLEQMMTLYAYSRRPVAKRHLMGGGFVFDDALVVEKNKWGVPMAYEVTTKDAFNLSEETLAEIEKELGKIPGAKEFVEAMQGYLSTVMGEKGNEVSMDLHGVKLFKEEFYLPVKSSEFYMSFNPEEAGEVRLQNPAFSKDVVPNSNNPIVLHNFTDLWAEHINDMSMYHSFVLALADFTRVYNYKTKSDPKLDTMDTKATLETAYPGVTKYINKFLKDMNGGVRGETVGWAEKLTSLTKKGATLGSASVTIQQPSAVMRAMGMVNPKYFVTTAHKSFNLAKHKQDWEELKKYAPIAGIKEMGRFDVGMGQGTVDWIKSNKTVMEKGEDILSMPPALMDEITWVTIWNAVKRETANKNPKLNTSSDEFLNIAGERFTEVVSLTQVYDSVFSRSDLMRNKSWIAKALTAFMAEPTTTLNMIWDGWVQAKRTGGFKAYAKATVTTGAPIVSAIVLNAALKSIIMAMRDDDEDESYAEKYLEHFVGEIADNINPLMLLPFAKDVVSIFKGYDVDRMDMALFNDLKKAIDAFNSEDKSAYEKWSGLIGAFSAFFGVPVKNVERDIRGFIKTVFGETEDATAMGILNAIEEGWTGKEKSNGQQLYEAMLSGDSEQIERVKGRFKDDKGNRDDGKINSAIRKALRENDPRIKEAAEARYNGDIAEYMKIAKEIIREGNFKQDDVVAAINSEINDIKKRNGETETSTPSNKVVSLYKIEDYYTALVNGDDSTAYAVKYDLIETEVANGKDRDEAEASFNSKFVSHVRDLYDAGEVTSYKAKELLVDYGGKSDEEASSKVQYWGFKKEYPDYDLSEESVKKYYSEVKSSGISVAVYYDYSKQRAKAKGVDLNGDGKTDSGSVKSEVMQIINSLPISSYQKDALYYLNGWSQSTIHEAPWH